MPCRILYIDMISFRIAGHQAFLLCNEKGAERSPRALGPGPPRSLKQACRAHSSTLWLQDGRPRVCMHALSRVWLCDPMGCSPPGSSVLGIHQARILEWVAISCFRRSSRPRDRTCVSCGSCIGRRVRYQWATWEARDGQSHLQIQHFPQLPV